ncbi:MAG TPA: MBL fold metallo-hydrolase [Methylomirabilota bacterium]|nr:MBL fold metallo-hydrolase [Methylomirabilota bacterium]
MIARLEFLGGAGTVTGSKILLEVAGHRTLLDCGLYQGAKELRLRNWESLPVTAASIDDVVLTHAHVDHAGYLPRLCKDGFRGPVHATHGTADLLPIMLADSGRLQEEEAEYHNLRGTSKHHPALPLYTASEGLHAAARTARHSYHQRFDLGASLAAEFAPSGHIVGAATVMFDVPATGGRRRLVCSGDLGRYAIPIMPDPTPIGDADYVVIEATYGDRDHDAVPIADQLARVITRTAARDGAIVIPAFAVGRTQEIMYHLAQLEQAGRIPALPCYIDSPMATRATEVYRAHRPEFDDDAQVLDSKRLRVTETVAESRGIHAVPGPIIIIAGSGMATGGRVLHHLRARLPDPRTTVLIVGYQALGTRGRALADGQPTVRIFGENVPVRAEVVTIHGLSAHADRNELLRWLRTARAAPRVVFVVHAEPDPASVFAETIARQLGWRVAVPSAGDYVNLD